MYFRAVNPLGAPGISSPSVVVLLVLRVLQLLSVYFRRCLAALYFFPRYTFAVLRFHQIPYSNLVRGSKNTVSWN